MELEFKLGDLVLFRSKNVEDKTYSGSLWDMDGFRSTGAVSDGDVAIVVRSKKDRYVKDWDKWEREFSNARGAALLPDVYVLTCKGYSGWTWRKRLQLVPPLETAAIQQTTK